MKKFLFFFILFAQLQLSAEIVDPHILIIFGATGDLTQRKLLPALYHLSKEGYLPENFIYVALGRGKKTQDEYKENIRLALQEHLPSHELEGSRSSQFAQQSFYFQLDFESPNDYQALQNYLKELENAYGTRGNRLFYLATPPSYFSTIVEKLYDYHLIDQDVTHWTRVIIEKPFGHDLDSANELQQKLFKYLEEDQIYLIDHYLGKEVVQNILTLRFDNPLFNKIWNNQFIDHVQITLSEDQGVGTRGNFWEKTGLLRDVVQNHLLQLISLIAMEPPPYPDSQAIRKQKVNLIKSIRPFSFENLSSSIIRGQYSPGLIDGVEIKGYRQEDHVASQSNVETFVAAKLFIDNERWQGVPFYVRAGKRLVQKLTEIVIAFKDPSSLFPTDQLNYLVIRIQPDEEIYLMLNSKTPGQTGQIQSIKMQFNYRSFFKQRLPEAYENLLYESMKGDHKLFVSLKEILASWQLLTPVLTSWQKNPPHDFPNYSPGSWGPEEAQLFLQKENHAWYLLLGDPYE